MYAPKVTPVLDTSVYTAGDVLFAPVEIKNVTPNLGGVASLIGFQITDESDQSIQFDIYFMDGNVALGTINNAPNISDALASGDIVAGPFKIVTADYNDLGGVRTALKTLTQHVIMQCAPGSNSLWMTAVMQSAVTVAAADLKIRPQFE